MSTHDLMVELLFEEHGDKVEFICRWYEKYRKAGLSEYVLRKILVQQGFLSSHCKRIVDKK